MRSAVATILLSALFVAGCFGGSGKDPADRPSATNEQLRPDGSIDHDAIARFIGEPIAMEHDHLDPAEHSGSFNMEFVAWSSLGVTLGENGFANFVLRDEPDGRTLAFIASDGDNRGGFVIADVTDPLNITVLGSHWLDGNNIQEVRVTPDGRYLAMNVQAIPEAAFFSSPDGLTDCGVCIQLYNIEDRANPRLVDVLPVELLGTHNMDFYQRDANSPVQLFYVGQPLAGTNPDPPGNRIGIASIFTYPDGGAKFLPVGTFIHDTTNDDGRSFPHDVLVAQHPLTRQHIAYVSHWQGGAITFDVGSPATAAEGELGRNADPEPSSVLAIHWLMQEPLARTDGRVIAWSAPEIGSLDDGTGVIRSYDVTDPSVLTQLGTWELPGEDLSISGAGGHYILSPHVAMPDQSTGLLAVAHYHAGVWILDISDPSQPRALGYYIPHGDPTEPYAGPIWWKKPNFDPDGYLPNVYMTRWHDGLLWVSERGTGLYALRYTGPIPGPVT